MSINKLIILLFVSLIQYIFGVELGQLEIQGIEPNGGPEYGETRVVVRLKEFNTDLINEYDRPKVIIFFHFFIFSFNSADLVLIVKLLMLPIFNVLLNQEE